jgi:hypothetical protein
MIALDAHQTHNQSRESDNSAGDREYEIPPSTLRHVVEAGLTFNGADPSSVGEDSAPHGDAETENAESNCNVGHGLTVGRLGRAWRNDTGASHGR